MIKKWKKKINKQVDDYIKGPDKFPLDESRWEFYHYLFKIITIW